MANILEHPALAYIYDLFEGRPDYYQLEINWEMIFQERNAYNFKSYYHVKSIDKLYGRYGTYIPLTHPEMQDLVDSINELLVNRTRNLYYCLTTSDSGEASSHIQDEYDFKNFIFFIGNFLGMPNREVQEVLDTIRQKNKLAKEILEIDSKNISQVIKL